MIRVSQASMGARFAATLSAAALTLGTAGIPTAAASSAPSAPAGQWGLDTTFGNGGVVLTSFSFGGEPDSGALSTVVQPDGAILAGGFTMDLDRIQDVASIARYLPDGELDRSFGDGGRVVLGPHALYEVRRIALQTVDGQQKILLAVATTFRNPWRYRCSVIRLNADGSLDTDHDADPAVVFGDQGVKVLRFEGNSGFCPDLTVTPTGDIVGIVEAASHRGDIGVFRLHGADGSLDPTFGGDGKMTIVAHGYQLPTTVALQPMPGGPDRIVIGGLVSLSHGYDWAIWRVTSEGRLDPTFGHDGKVVTAMRDPQVEQSFDAIDSLTVAPDRHIVAGGRYRAWPEGASWPEDTAAVAEYLPNGALDTSFGDEGRAHLAYDSGGETEAADITVDPQGRIAYTGPFEAPRYTQFVVGGFQADGSPDPRFGAGGAMRLTIGSGGLGEGLTFDSAGRLVVVGYGGDPSGGVKDVFGVVRLQLTRSK